MIRPIIIATCLGLTLAASVSGTDRFEGQYFSGAGDVEYLQLLDIARRMFGPDPEFQNVAMLYTPDWNGFIEGPTWNAWWIQNSYGPTYCALPFYDEPLTSFLQNAQNLWFDQMGDGKTVRPHKHIDTLYEWVPPDGCLCDAARPGWFVAKQGDGRVDIHDWGFEFTAAGMLLEAELLLISRDRQAINNFLPKLERCANFIESRRDPKNNLFLVGPAANLLAPSYAGWKRSDGTYDKAYLTGLSVTYVAGLDRLIQLCKMMGEEQKAELYTARRDSARAALKQLTTDEGYFIKYLDPDGTKHGVYGAEKHGYFEASPNHDAIAFRVVDDIQAKHIYTKIASLPDLRPHDFVLPNYPGLDDMYKEPVSIWRFGHWVNGGHWSTCEARMIMAYYRLEQYEDARRSMQQLMTFARRFRMDNPLTEFGSEVYQPNRPINLCYDSFGPPAALVRGLFEYLYTANGLTLIPHIPPGITELQQRFPIRFGHKRLYLATSGTGSITKVLINGKPCKSIRAETVFLDFEETPDVAVIEILLGDAPSPGMQIPQPKVCARATISTDQGDAELARLDKRAARLLAFSQAMAKAKLGRSYEAAHACLAADFVATIHERQAMLADGRIKPLAEPSQTAADKSYIDTADKLCTGIENVLDNYTDSNDAGKKQIHALWTK